jgi:integrase/recombinase XerD
MPLTAEEYARLLDAVPASLTWDGTAKADLWRKREAVRMRALIQLMRWSGLSVRDAAMLERSGLVRDEDGIYNVVTSREKTGTDVRVPLPPAVAGELLACPNDNDKYFFFHGASTGQNFACCCGKRIAAAFESAGIEDVCFMKSHRLRDTFAVDLLEKGLPMEEVSKLLAHDSIKTTERHYAKWVPARQARLKALVVGTWDSPASV